MTRPAHLALLLPGWLLAASSALAQTATGIVTGRIYNPATQEYVRNAEIAAAGTNLVAYSGDDGSYLLSGVPAGNVTLTVIYTGYQTASAQVALGAGLTATRDFELTGAVYTPGLKAAQKETAVVLDQFVVSSEREGNAKAIMEQRASLNVKSVVASDNFGDITGGNIGEFIKYLPGVVMDYNNSDARSARIGGLDPRYVGVSVDGMTMASAASASFGNATRQFEFEQASIYGTDAIEISKTTTASMDADAPAGRINLRSRSAFDRKGREVTLTGNTYSWNLRRTPGPYEGDDYKVRPGFLFSYAEAFQRRFGVSLTLGANTVATEQAGVTHTFNYANAARGPVITQINFRDAPKLTTRSSFNLTTDYKFSPTLAFSLRTSGSHMDDGTNNRQLILIVNPAQIDAASTLTDLLANPTANANTRMQLTTSRRNKINHTITYTPKLEYKRGDLTLTAGGGYSRSRTAYEQFTRGHFEGVTNRITRMSWRAGRSSPTSADWYITQTSGLPWSDPQSYNRADAFANNATVNPQAGRNQIWVGQLDARKTVDAGLPVQIAVGWKTKQTVYDLERNGALQWTYVGAAGSQTDSNTTIPTFTRYPFDPKRGGNVSSLNLPRPDPYTLYDLFVANPSHFTPNTINNHTNQYYSSRAIKEQIDAGYVEGSTRWNVLRLNLGVRHERSRIAGRTHNLIPSAVVQRAGFAPNTIPFVDYQYRSGRRESKYGGYANTFLSGGAKWAFTRNFVLQAAYSESIARPSYGNLAGVITINETNQTVRVPNPDLKPETSDKFFVSLQHYLEPAGTLSISGYRLFVKNMGVGNQTITADDAGYADDPEYLGYTFLRPGSAPGRRRIDGVELEYSQQLVFLPRAWRGFSVFGSLARTIADARAEDLVPKSANGGLRYSNHRFNAQLRCTWAAARFNSASGGEEQWQYERIMFDFSGGYRLNQTYEITLTGRNILDSPIANYSNEPGRLRSSTVFGPAWTLGVRGRF
ncbi:MAG: TonB-dependent receptor [Verrucomicrobia bacterium]|nr:TonB-dependent receptor [Verrucomicrobiota bacterium]